MKLVISIFLMFMIAATFWFFVTYNQMIQQVSLRPYEELQLQPPEGSVAVDAEMKVVNREDAALLTNPLQMNPETVAAGKLAYRRYCWACHGANLDGNSTVGPSLPDAMIDLKGERISSFSDGEYYWIMGNRVKADPPIGTSMTPQERWQTIVYMRSRQSETNQ